VIDGDISQKKPPKSTHREESIQTERLERFHFRESHHPDVPSSQDPKIQKLEPVGKGPQKIQEDASLTGQMNFSKGECGQEWEIPGSSKQVLDIRLRDTMELKKGKDEKETIS